MSLSKKKKLQVHLLRNIFLVRKILPNKTQEIYFVLFLELFRNVLRTAAILCLLDIVSVFICLLITAGDN